VILDRFEYEVMYRVEDKHWWYRGMAAISRALLQRYLPSPSNLKILDSGCGTGAAMQSLLSDRGPVFGLDLSLVALDYCRLRQLQPLTCGSVDHLPYASGSFDLVTSFDVLYARSVPDVLAAMKEMTRVLSPKGYLLLRLPAYDWLRGRHDIAVQTAQRFSMKAVTKLLYQCNLTILHQSYANTFLFPFALMKRSIEKTPSQNATTSDLTVEFGWLDKVLGKILSVEAPLISHLSLPFGLSLVAIAQKQ
jgi:SAM-dependent methyltransferase